ncbi:hypothetical protein ACLKA6_001466 [Drosophila palustris]
MSYPWNLMAATFFVFAKLSQGCHMILFLPSGNFPRQKQSERAREASSERRRKTCVQKCRAVLRLKSETERQAKRKDNGS